MAVVVCAGAVAQDAPSAEAGRWRVLAQGQALAVYDGGVLVKTLDAASRDGRQRSSVTAIRFVPARRSFVIGFDTLTELWELSIDPAAEPVFDGLVHDYRLGEGLAAPGFLGVRRTLLAQALRDLRIDDSGAFVLGRERAREGKGDAGALVLINLDIRRVMARFAAMP
jgi:hypothetical protein